MYLLFMNSLFPFNKRFLFKYSFLYHLSINLLMSQEAIQLMETNKKFIQITQLKNQLLSKCQSCQKCSQYKLYKCMQPSCISQKLICPQCDTFNLQGNHFNHSFTYILPLLVGIHPSLIFDMHQKMQDKIMELKDTFSRCIDKLQKMLIQNVRLQQEFKDYLCCKNLAEFTQNINARNLDSLQSLLNSVCLFTADEAEHYLKRAAYLNRQILYQHIQKQSDQYKFLKNVTEELEKITHPVHENKGTPYFLLNRQTFVIDKDDQKFRTIKEFYTDNWAYTSVEVKIVGKTSLYNKLYPFQRCRKLKIKQSNSQLIEQDAESSQLKFSNLRQITISGREELLKKTKGYWSKAIIVTIDLPDYFDQKISTHFQNAEEINLSFQFSIHRRNYDDFGENLRQSFGSKCSVISIQEKRNWPTFWTKKDLEFFMKRNSENLMKLECNTRINLDQIVEILEQISRLPKILKFKVPIKLENGFESEFTDYMIEDQVQISTKNRFEKEKAIACLLKEYQLKKFIKKKKTRFLFEDLCMDFLIGTKPYPQPVFVKIKDIQPGQLRFNLIAKVIQIKRIEPGINGRPNKCICIIGDQTGVTDAYLRQIDEVAVGKSVALYYAEAAVIYEHIMLKSKIIRDAKNQIDNVNHDFDLSVKAWVPVEL